MTELSKAQLSEFDFRILIDASGSMADTCGEGTRWDKAKEITKAMAEFAGEIDDDGIDVIVFGGTFEPSRDVYKNVTADKVYEIFNNRRPSGSTPLDSAVKEAISLHQAKAGKKSFNVVVTDGQPNHQEPTVSAIRDFSNTLNADSDSTFLFLQVGDDIEATKFLIGLDDNLKGSKFDIVDRKTEAEWKALTFTELFYQAMHG